MLRAMRASLFALVLFFGSAAYAQSAPVPSQPLPAEPAPAEPAPAAPPSDPAAPTEPVAPAPAPEPAPTFAAEPAPPPPTTAEPMPQYDGQVDAEGRAHYTGEPPEEDYGYEDASYPPAEPDEDGGDDDFEVPPFSIRIDPFNWLIEGRLGLELEVGVLDFMTIELVPILVANSEPPTFNFTGREDPLSQESNGLGPIAGASLGVGFWFAGEPLNGYVLRAALTNVGITYKSSDASGVFDEVTHTERRLVFMLGSHSRFGFFTLAGGIGLGYELNQQTRCFENSGSSGNPSSRATTSGCADDDELHIALDDPSVRSASNLSVADLNGFLHPVYLEGRFSIGVSFD
jgi:hypothetical protein